MLSTSRLAGKYAYIPLLGVFMITLFPESVPAFEDTWIECLGNWARYRMAIKGSNFQDHETWASMSWYWYYKAANKDLNNGRIQHHLAVLSWPNILQQLFYYTRSLVSVDPSPTAGESIQLLFHRRLNEPKSDNLPIFASAFVAAHDSVHASFSV